MKEEHSITKGILIDDLGRKLSVELKHDDFLTINRLIEEIFKPLLLAVGYSDKLVEKYLGTTEYLTHEDPTIYTKVNGELAESGLRRRS